MKLVLNKAQELQQIKFTCNLSHDVVRHDQMEGEDYLVVPMVMLTEGVHSGTQGPLLYPKNELKKVPQVWNHKPIVVYHPDGVTACDPEILTNRKVGIIMNARIGTFNTVIGDGIAGPQPITLTALKAEAWLKEARCNIVDKRIMEAVENQETMELSTGLYSENEHTPGDWYGEAYDAICRNYRPDHLALLPDRKGACSIADGAGFIRNQESIEPITNEQGYDTIRGMLQGELNDSETWVVDIYQTFFIYEKEGKLYKRDYKLENDVAVLVGTAIEVVRVTEYRTTDGKFIGNIRKDVDMSKKKIVDALIANVSTRWGADDKEYLMSLDEEVLNKMAPVVNDDLPEVPAAEVESAAAEVPVAEVPEEETVENYLKKAPPKIAAILNQGLSTYEAEKTRLVNVIVANERCTMTEKQLRAKDNDELFAIATMVAPKKVAKPLFNGQEDPIGNAGQEALSLPSTE